MRRGLSPNHNPMDGGAVKPVTDGVQKMPMASGRRSSPLDFSMMDFSDLEESTRSPYHMKDDWMCADEVSPLMEVQSGVEKEGKKAVGTWRREYRPVIPDCLIPLWRMW